jgi:hypothetical protein
MSEALRPRARGALPHLQLPAATQPIVATAALCLVLMSAARILGGFGHHLTLDEGWTGAIIDQPDLAHLVHEIYLDVNAPLYYVLAYAWSHLFGLSDAALRAPSAILGIATPLLICRVRVPGLSSSERLTWAVVMASWFPGIWFAHDARSYALLLFLSVGQTLTYATLMTKPTLRRATWWSLWSALAILAHYDAGFLALCEGLLYLAVHRRAAVRTWPAAVAFVPTAGWIAYHLPSIIQYTRPDVAWHLPLTFSDLPGVFDFFFAPHAVLLGLAAMGILALLANGRLAPPRPDGDADPTGRPIWAYIVGTAAAGAAIVVAIGFVSPSVSFRYLTPSAPGMLLGLVVAMRPFARRFAPLYPAMMVLCAGCGAMVTYAAVSQMLEYSFEQAADDLAAAPIDRLVFTLDSSTSTVLPRSTLAAVGGFFFARAGRSITVDPVVLRPGEDASAALLQAAGTDPRSAILWLYNLGQNGVVAKTSPPAITERAPAWRCHNYGGGAVGVLACLRRGKPG